MAAVDLTVEFRDVPDFPGYRVGSDGSLWSRFLGRSRTAPWRKLTPVIHRTGKKYLGFHLRKGGRRHKRLIHRLVLEAFIGPRPPLAECRHLDGNPQNNALINLCWGTHAENTADTRRLGRFDAILTEDQVRTIRDRYADGGILQRELAAEFGVSRMAVGSIITRRSWRHLD